ncbi:MAG: glycosyltransferase family 9 protein [Chloroflexi bacterium]|nr:glycosyltransferase family 9 protein [Chloroflexota bacterium]
MAEIYRRPTAKQRLRDVLLSAAARIPVRAAGGGSQRLLIVRPDHLGDVLLCTPTIEALKRSSPCTSIHALCGDWSAPVLANYPGIDHVLTIPFPGFQRGDRPAKSPWQLAMETARLLRTIGYGAAIIMRPDHWWGALVTYLAGIRRRVGYDVGNVAPFLTEVYQLKAEHTVEQNMRLVESWTGEISRCDIQLRFPVQAADHDFLERKLREWRLPQQQALICIHPGSGRDSKIWRGDKWASAADAIATQYQAAIIFTGTAAEIPLINDIVDSMKVDAAIVAGATTVGQLAALYERSTAVLGPDSGAMHLAAAVRAPTVALFGPADPGEFAPWGDPRRHAVVTSNIGCRPCRILDWGDDDSIHHPCVADISVEQVLEATRRVLSSETGAEDAPTT